MSKVSKQNFSDCIDGLNKCVEDGGTFGECVTAAPVCEKKAKAGCCPAVCVSAFKSEINDKSEAEAFREVFAAGSICRVPTAGRAAAEDAPADGAKADSPPPSP